jgi:hypothetical protein
VATYSSSAGTFTWSLLLTDAAGWVSLFPSQKVIVRKSVPFAFAAGSSQLTQILGVNNPTETFTILANNDGVAPSLEALWQAQATGTLDLTAEFGPGFSYSNVSLVDVKAKKRRPWESLWEIEVTFEQVQ